MKEYILLLVALAVLPRISRAYILSGPSGFNVCEGFECKKYQVCVPLQVTCVKEPCFPVPICINKSKNPCKKKHKCPDGTVCAVDLSGEGYVCLGTPDKPVDKCADVSCLEGYKCENGICIPIKPVGPVTPFELVCKGFPCPKNSVCVPHQVICVTEPCFPEPGCFKKYKNPCKDVDCPSGTICAVAHSGKGHVCLDKPDHPKPVDKCAFTLCIVGTTCVDGECIPNKGGVCPPANGIGICVEECSHDSCCPGNQLCCSNGCGHTCQDPVTKISEFCNTISCPDKLFCIPQEVACVTSPCFPSPTCVTLEDNPCALVKCGFNTVCIISLNGGAKCVPDDPTDPCLNIICGDGEVCVMKNNFPTCVPAEKPGGCPQLFQFTFCEEFINECEDDQNCPGAQKCCRASCGTQCADPVDTTEKPGVCPDLGFDDFICDLFECNFDSECKGAGKCCDNQCGSLLCAVPDLCEGVKCGLGEECTILSGGPLCVPIKPPDCSAVLCIVGTICINGVCVDQEPIDPCTLIDCAVGTQCIDGVCVPERQGVCPPAVGPGLCVEECSSDFDCKGDQLCCSNGCGHTCQDPVSPLALSCSTIICEKGYTCELLQVQCIRAPCPPLPSCIPIDENPCAVSKCPAGTVCVVIDSDEAICMPDGGDPCSQPLDSGPCRGSLNRYYYNAEAKECQQFTYGGCGGNYNRFETLKDCENTCSDDPCDSVKCPEGTVCEIEGDIDCDPLTERCPLRPIILRCRDICTLPVDAGPCKALFPYYYYNAKLEECQSFNYGGCQGNENKFKTLQECENQCHEETICETVECDPGTECVVVEGDINEPRHGECKDTCLLPADSGPCEALIIRYHYDPNLQACRTFTYGGCKGNGNNFETLEDCSESCEEKFLCEELECGENEVCIIQGDCDPTTTICIEPLRRAQCVSICFLPKDVGPCDGDDTRYFYDADENVCTKFSFGGCEGNENNFETKTECEKICGQKSEEKSSSESSSEEKPKEKPGGCPIGFPFIPVICNDVENECEDDSGCPGAEKCCQAICGNKVCMDPIDTTEKEGECPEETGPVICDLFDCSYDSQCDGKKKCCMNSCGSTECLDPVKPLSCPPPEDIASEHCQTPCKSDYDCSQKDKCCENSKWQNVCTPPVNPPPKEPKCPDNSKIVNVCAIFEDSCLSDSECPEGLLCCKYGCGKRCLKPVYY